MSELIQYKCPNCGGSVQWDSRSQKVKCPYCDTEFDVETMAAADEALNDAGDEDDLTWDTTAGTEWEDGETDGMRLYVCDSCGGEIICYENTAASVCPYCDSPVVMKGNFSGRLKPDYVIPFKYDKKAAKEAYYRHISGKKLLPKIFRDENHIDEIKGLYVPFWLFDADARGNMVFNATRTRVWADMDFEYTETSFYKVFRSGEMSFSNVPVDGSSQMPDELMQSIEPFDMNEAVDFRTAYLAGYLADKYDVTADDNLEIANNRIKNSTATALRNTVMGYGTVTEESGSVRLSNGKAKYAFYPVWLLNTTFKGQKFTFAMNGQTGKMVGDLPLDKSAFWKNLFIYGGIGTVIAFAAQYLLWMM